MLKRIKAVLNSPYAAPLTEPVRWTSTLMRFPLSYFGMAYQAFKKAQNPPLSKADRSFIKGYYGAMDDNNSDISFFNAVGGTAGGIASLFLTAFLCLETPFLAGLPLAAQIAAGLTCVVTATVVGAVAAPFVLAGAGALVCAALGAGLSPFSVSSGIVKAVFKKPAPARQSSLVTVAFVQPTISDSTKAGMLVAQMTAEEKQKFLTEQAQALPPAEQEKLVSSLPEAFAAAVREELIRRASSPAVPKGGMVLQPLPLPKRPSP